MGFVGSMFSGSKGLGYQAGRANINAPVSEEDARKGLQQQQDFLNALAAQNGIQNQTNVYNQFADIAAGKGPNPAQAMLAQETARNVANQAALAASQRGAAQNVGLLARQAGMQGGNLQQQAVGQGAIMQANQQLGALGQMGTIAQQEVANRAQNLQAYNQNLQGYVQGQNQANVAMQSNINNANAAIQGEVARQQGAMFGNFMNSLGAAGSAQMVSKGAGGAGGPAMEVAAHGGTVGSMVKLAEGGNPFQGLINQKSAEQTQKDVQQAPEVVRQQREQSQSYATGGEVDPNESSFALRFIKGFGAAPVQQQQTPEQALGQGTQSMVRGVGNLIGSGIHALQGPAPTTGGVQPQIPLTQSQTTMNAGFAKGGKVPALVSPGEGYLTPDKARKVAEGKANPIKSAEKIPGKAKVKGDSYANDTVPRNLDEGGIVLPRSIMQSKDPAKAAHDFVVAHLAKHGHLPKKK